MSGISSINGPVNFTAIREQVAATEHDETYVVITAAGSGTRLGAKQPKALVTVAGKPLVIHAIENIAALAQLQQIVVTAPTAALTQMRETLKQLSPQTRAKVTVVPGGSTRQESVFCGLKQITKDNELTADSIVLIHDAARAFAPAAVAQRVIDAIKAGAHAVVPTLPAVDTMRVIATDQAEIAGTENGVATISGTEIAAKELDRATVRIVQTPQGFRGKTLWQAHQTASQTGQDPATDDAALVAALGFPVHLVPGDQLALKVTHPIDIKIVEQLVNRP